MASLAPSLAAAGDVVLRRFNSGAGADAVGMVDASEDTEIAGPQAIYAGEGDEVYLLDQVNGRVLGFDPRQPDGADPFVPLPGGAAADRSDRAAGRDHRVGRHMHVLRPTGPDERPRAGSQNHLRPAPSTTRSRCRHSPRWARSDPKRTAIC